MQGKSRVETVKSKHEHKSFAEINDVHDDPMVAKFAAKRLVKSMTASAGRVALVSPVGEATGLLIHQ